MLRSAVYVRKPSPRNFVPRKLCVQLSFFVNKANSSDEKIAFEIRFGR